MTFLGLFILFTFYSSFFSYIIKHKTNHELAFVYHSFSAVFSHTKPRSKTDLFGIDGTDNKKK